MNRITDYKYVEAIERACRSIPDAILDLVRVDFFCGTDPIYAGLIKDYDTGDGRSYKDTACFHNGIDKPTIILPVFETPETIVHEFGHALDWVLGCKESTNYFYSDIYEIPQVDEWKENSTEVFANAFLFYLAEEKWQYERKLAELYYLFDSLS